MYCQFKPLSSSMHSSNNIVGGGSSIKMRSFKLAILVLFALVNTSKSQQSNIVSPSSHGGSDLMDDDLVQIAKAAVALALDDSSLTDKIEIFVSSKSDAARENLQRATMGALGRGSASSFEEMAVEEDGPNFCPALKTWNNRGTDVTTDGKTERESICDSISKPESLVSADVRACMCGSTELFIRCEMMLGSSALQHHERRKRERRQRRRELAGASTLVESNKIRGRRDQVTCSLSTTPSDLLGGNPSLEDLIGKISGDAKGFGVAGSCCFDLPPPVNIFEVCGEVGISVPDLKWATLDGALSDLEQGNIIEGSTDIKEQAASVKGSLTGKLCLSINSELENADIEIIEDILEFLGIDLCFASLGVAVWPIRGHSRFTFELKLLVFFFARASLSLQADVTLRDTLGLCDNVEPGCGDEDSFFCSMDAGDAMGNLELGLTFFIWNPSVSWPIGESSAYDECDKWEDGIPCLLGTSCGNCLNPPSYWYAKAFTACGSEPTYSDGTICLVGTSCNQCQNPHSFWPDRFTWACGDMPCWNDATVCLAGTTCKECCNPSSFWAGKFTWACGNEPCWNDGTVCLAGTTCNECCNSWSWWAGKFTYACGNEPCWSSGTTCGPGTTCRNCCNGSWFFNCS